MLRFAGFLLLTFVVFSVLTRIPIIGSLAGSVPLFGFFIAAVIVSRVLAKLGSAALDRRRQKSLVRELGAVDTPRNQGKLGQLFLAQRRYRQAIPLLQAAAEAEPNSADWNYRLGRAMLGATQFNEACEVLTRAIEIDEEHGYGGAMMRLAEAQLKAGNPDSSLTALQRVDRNHGPSPECAYRQGLALKALGRKSEAVQAFSSVGGLAAQAVGYQKRAASSWSLRATLARMF